MAQFLWTAPGDDYDKGTAARYEIRCYSGHSVQRQKHLDKEGIDIDQSSLPLPMEYGTKQSAEVEIPWPNEVFFFAIISVDDVG